MKLQHADPALAFILPKDLTRVLNTIKHYNGAYRHYEKIKQRLGKAKHQKLTVKEFSEWEGLDPVLVMQRLAAS